MVLVDTSVWIEFLQRPSAPHAVHLARLIQDNNQAVMCGIVLQEILQGIRDGKSHALTRDLLLKLPYLETGKDVHLAASDLYRALRSKGITVPSTDAVIAALAMANRLPLYSKDEHFSVIALHSRLELFA